MARRRGERRTVDRFLSRCGIASRTRAAGLIREGRVAVNGRTATDPDQWIDPARDRVTVDGAPVAAPARHQLVLFNKPRGVLVTERDPQGRPTVRDALPEPFRSDPALRPAGRLDQDSGGLLLFTSDNDLAEAILDKRSRLAKRYRVKFVPAPDPPALETMRRGVEIGDRTPTLPARIRVERTGPRSAVLEIEIVEGRNRQIRRMAAAVGCQVQWLVRVAIGPVRLEALEVGEAREATEAEAEALRAEARVRQ